MIPRQTRFYTIQTVTRFHFGFKTLFQNRILLTREHVSFFCLSPPRRNQPVSVSSLSIWLLQHIPVQIKCNLDACQVQLNKG